LRQFYWFENAVWRINKISDWNIGLEDVTKVEFIKVQDLSGYTSITQTKSNSIRMYASKYNVAPNGEIVTLSLETLNGGNWTIKTNADDKLVLSKSMGTGNSDITLTIPQTNTPTQQRTYSITAVDNEGNTATINIAQGYNGQTNLTLNPTKLIVPANGGTYNIDFQWVNQGDNEVSAASFMGDVTGNVEIDGFSAAVSVNESNEEDTIISGKVFFEAGEYDREVLIDQMPSLIEFGKDGGEYELVFNYNDDVTYNHLPYWATVENNKITVIPNYYESERSANIMVQNNHSFAYIRLKQAVGNSPAPETPKVSPNNLYFDMYGGVRYVNVNITDNWKVTEISEWVTVNIEKGEGYTVMSATVGLNEGDSREGEIKILDIQTGEEYIIKVYQTEFIEELYVTPTEIVFDGTGGTTTLKISSNTLWDITLKN
jgi:hypothetical protein